MVEGKTFKAVLFDKDGVLVDFDKTWIAVLLKMAKELADVDEVLENKYLEVAGYDHASGRCLSGSVWAAGNNDELVRVWQEVGTGRTDVQLNEFIETCCLSCTPVPICPPEQLQALFKNLTDAGLQLGIATNDFEASASHSMEIFGLSSYLTQVLGYDSVKNPKPAADPVIAFAGATGVSASEIVVVGDNVHDMEMASAGNAGLAVGVLSGNSLKCELAPFADMIIDDVRELPKILSLMD